MGFYRRYSGLQPPTLPVPPGTGTLPQQTPAGVIEVGYQKQFPPTPKEVYAFQPKQPIRSYAPGLFDENTAASFMPSGSIFTKATNTNPGAVGPAQELMDHPNVRKAAASDANATKKAQQARDAARVADAAVYEANKANAKAATDPNAETEAAAKSSEAVKAQRQSEAALQAAKIANAKAEADAAAAQKIVDQGTASPNNDGGSLPYDNSGGGYDPYGSKTPSNDYAYDNVAGSTDISEAIPPGDPRYPTSPSSGPNLLAIAAAGGGGFLAGGPVGAVIGAAVGYFISKPAAPARASTQIARYRGFYRR